LVADPQFLHYVAGVHSTAGPLPQPPGGVGTSAAPPPRPPRAQTPRRAHKSVSRSPEPRNETVETSDNCHKEDAESHYILQPTKQADAETKAPQFKSMRNMHIREAAIVDDNPSLHNSSKPVAPCQLPASNSSNVIITHIDANNDGGDRLLRAQNNKVNEASQLKPEDDVSANITPRPLVNMYTEHPTPWSPSLSPLLYKRPPSSSSGVSRSTAEPAYKDTVQISVWPPAMNSSDIQNLKASIDRSREYANRLRMLASYDCGLRVWIDAQRERRRFHCFF
jgi:hypothetical protein